MAAFSDSYRPRTSGVVHSVASLAAGLRRLGHRVHLFVPRYPGYSDAEPDVHRLPAVRLPPYPDFPLLLPWQPGLLRRLRTLGIEVVHVHSPFVAGRLGLQVGRALGVPVVFTHHTRYPDYVHYAPWIPRGLLARSVRAHVVRFCNRCDAVIAPSEAIARILRSQGVRTRIAVIPTAALDLDAIARTRPADRTTLGIPRDRILVTYVGRLAREKGLELLLDAFARACVGRDLHLLLVGEGPERPALERRAERLGIADRVTFAGLRPHPEVLAWLCASDLFAFASQTETQGIAVAEAQACGLPVAAVDATGTAETVRDGETGFLVPPDPEALAQACGRLADDPELRRRMGERAQALSARWSVEGMTERVAGLYRALWEEDRTPAGRSL